MISLEKIAVRKILQSLVVVGLISFIGCSGMKDRIIGREYNDYINECKERKCIVREARIPPNSKLCHLYIDLNDNGQYNGFQDVPLGLAFARNRGFYEYDKDGDYKDIEIFDAYECE